MENNPTYKLKHGIALWYTGLPSSGKTSIAQALRTLLEDDSIPVIVLDGDRVRPIIASDLDFSEESRYESLLRYIKLTNLLIEFNVIVLVSVINHSQKQRNHTRENHPEESFMEVWVDTPLEECRKRDVKGLYEKSSKGELSNMVGMDIAYEPPENYDIRLETLNETTVGLAKKVHNHLLDKGIIYST